MSISDAQKLIKKLKDVKIDEQDITNLCLDILYDIQGDTAQHAKARIEALRLLSDITIKKKNEAESDFGDEAILKVLSGGKK